MLSLVNYILYYKYHVYVNVINIPIYIMFALVNYVIKAQQYRNELSTVFNY